MDNNIKEVLHLYLGCKFVMRIRDTDTLTSPIHFSVDALKATYATNQDKITPILLLRRLSSMSEEEAREIWDSTMERTGYKYNHVDRLLASCNRIEVIAPVIPELLKRGFWLFSPDAFDKGLIIDRDAPPDPGK
jgi:hypothetical protein